MKPEPLHIKYKHELVEFLVLGLAVWFDTKVPAEWTGKKLEEWLRSPASGPATFKGKVDTQVEKLNNNKYYRVTVIPQEIEHV